MKSLETRILEVYERLSPSEQRLAEVLLEHQTDLPSYTASELANRAGVSKATAARLFKSLGYATYSEAKRQVRSMKNWGSPLLALSELDAAQQVDGLARKHRDSDVANISKTFQTLDPSETAAIVGLLEHTERVWILGLRNGSSVALFLRYFLGMIKSDVRLLPQAGSSFAEDFASIEPGDVLMAVAFRRRPRQLRSLLNQAHDLGAKSVLVTDLSASESARYADYVIRCWCRSPALFDSYTSAISVLGYILSLLALTMGDDIRARLERIELLHTAVDDLSGPGK